MQSLTPPPIDIATLTINDIYCYDFGEWQVQKNDDDQKIWVRVRWEQPISKAVDIIVHSLAMKKKANNKKIILDNVLIKEEYMDTTTVMKKQMVSTKFITEEKNDIGFHRGTFFEEKNGFYQIYYKRKNDNGFHRGTY